MAELGVRKPKMRVSYGSDAMLQKAAGGDMTARSGTPVCGNGLAGTLFGKLSGKNRAKSPDAAPVSGP